MKNIIGLRWLGVIICFFLIVPVTYASTTVFNTNFNSGVPGEFSGVTTLESVGSYSGIGGFSGDFLRNVTGGNPAGATILTLNGLPPHSSVGLQFLLAIIDSWDGNDPTWGPDFFNVEVDGVPIFNETITVWTNQYDPGTDQSYHPRPQVILSNDPLAYDMGFESAFTFPHTASSLTIEWFAGGDGWQGDGDESWAIDNVEVILDPEPPVSVAIPTMAVWSLALLAGLLGGFGYLSNKRHLI